MEQQRLQLYTFLKELEVYKGSYSDFTADIDNVTIRQQLYNAFKENGWFDGDYATFAKNIDVPSKRLQLYEALNEDELTSIDWESFNRILTGNKKRFYVMLKSGKKKQFDTKEEADTWCERYNGYLHNKESKQISEDLLVRFTDESIAFENYLKEEDALDKELESERDSFFNERKRRREELKAKYNIENDSATKEINEIFKVQRKEKIQGYAIDCALVVGFVIAIYLIYRNIKEFASVMACIKNYITRRMCRIYYNIKCKIMGLKERIMKNKTKSAVCGAVVCALLVFAYWQYGDKRCMSDDSLIYYECVNSRNFVLHANVGCSEARSVTGVWSKYGELEISKEYGWREKLCTHCFWSWDIEKVLKRDYENWKNNNNNEEQQQ